MLKARALTRGLGLGHSDSDFAVQGVTTVQHEPLCKGEPGGASL